jgi:hypothetical protein
MGIATACIEFYSLHHLWFGKASWETFTQANYVAGIYNLLYPCFDFQQKINEEAKKWKTAKLVSYAAIILSLLLTCSFRKTRQLCHHSKCRVLSDTSCQKN